MGDRHFWQNLFTPLEGREMAQVLDRSRWAACFNFEVRYRGSRQRRSWQSD